MKMVFMVIVNNFALFLVLMASNCIHNLSNFKKNQINT